MKVAIIAPHSFPIPPPTYSGEVVIYDLARSLDEMDHQVDLYAPAGSWEPPHGALFPTPCSFGALWPRSEEAEQQTWAAHRERLLQADVVHDFSNTKGVAELMYHEDHHRNVISTLLGGYWDHPRPPYNIVVWSKAMRDRGLRGATDYEHTTFHEIDNKTKAQHPGCITDAHVVPGGTDTEFYCPGGGKDDYLLWLNRWHPAKGYQVAIELARRTGIPLVMAGLHPDAVFSDHHRQCALEAVELAKGLPNVQFRWLPREPAETHHALKRSLYQRARALLYTTQFQEPFGLGQVEALACGTPVVGINFGSVPEVIEDGKTGLVVGNSVSELAAAVSLVSKIDPRICREEAIRRFDRRVMTRAYCNEYKAIIEGQTWGFAGN